MKSIYTILVVTGFVALLTVIYGFSITGSPAHARDLKFDEKRVTDLQGITYAIQNYADLNNALPMILNDLTLSSYYSVNDPETGAQYSYQVTGEAYKICATFKTSVLDTKEAERYVAPEFKHPKGYYCFDKNVTLRNTFYNTKSPVNIFQIQFTPTPGVAAGTHKTTPVKGTSQ